MADTVYHSGDTITTTQYNSNIRTPGEFYRNGRTHQTSYVNPIGSDPKGSSIPSVADTKDKVLDNSHKFGKIGFEGDGNGQYNETAVFKDAGAAFGGTTFGPTFNIQAGGQLGFGNRPISMDGATPLPLNCANVFVLQMPRFWNRFPAAQRAYKAMIELNATSIDGIDLNYTLESADIEAGHDGQMASMPTMSKRAAVSPSVTLNEIGGNVFWNLNYMWIKHIAHPDTCSSLLASMYGDNLEQWVWSTFTATWLVVQPDPTGLPDRIVDAAVITNIFPTETGNLGIKRQIGSAELAKRTVNYKGIITHNEHTRELGRLVMRAVNAHRPNLDYSLTWDGVKSNIGKYGHQGWLRRANSEGLMSVVGQNAPVQQQNDLYGNIAEVTSKGTSTTQTYNGSEWVASQPTTIKKTDSTMSNAIMNNYVSEIQKAANDYAMDINYISQIGNTDGGTIS